MIGSRIATRRFAAICIVVVLHSLLVLLAWNMRSKLHDRSRSADQFVIWVPVTQPESHPSLPDLPEVAIDRSAILTADQTVPPNQAISLPPAQLPGASINWHANAAFQARKTVQDSVTERYRNFGPRKPGPPPEPAIPSVFEQEPEVFGEEGEDSYGDPVVRLSKNCYQELPKRIQKARDYVNPGMPLMKKCMFPIGTPEPRGDLFEHLKRERPLPAPRPDDPHELPLRDPAREGQ